MKKKTKIIAGAAAAAVVLAGSITGVMMHRGNSDAAESAQVYADNVGMLTGLGLGTEDRFTGVVEAQDTLKVAKDSDQTVGEIYVEKGDTVEKGTVLFSYDTDELNLKIEEGELKLEGLQGNIDSYKSQIEELTKEKKSASADEQLSYTTQIQEAELAEKQAEYDYKVQQMDVEKLKKSLETSEVTSTISGIVQDINEDGGYDSSTGEEKPFMTIRAVGEYRVKCTISEQNIYEIGTGMQMAVISRVDDSLVWYGTIDTIDTNQTASSNSSYYDSSSGEQASKYYFYITLDSSDGLMLGQHVYVQADLGEDSDEMKLMSDYIIQDDGDPYVWAVDEDDKLEKRTVELGDYDEDSDEYVILSGLETTDYIAWPSEECKVGAAAYKNDGTVEYSYDGDSEVYDEESYSDGDAEVYFDEETGEETEAEE